MKYTATLILIILCFKLFAQNNVINSDLRRTLLKGEKIEGDTCMMQALNLTEICDISPDIEIMVDRYIYNKTRANSRKCYMEGFIYIMINPYLIDIYTKQDLFDSLYSENCFSDKESIESKGSAYKLFISLANQNNNILWLDHGKKYYYNYKGYKLIISSYLPVTFNEVGTKTFYIIRNKDYKPCTKCDDWDYTLETIFEWGSTGIREVRYRDIKWTEGIPIEQFE